MSTSAVLRHPSPAPPPPPSAFPVPPRFQISRTPTPAGEFGSSQSKSKVRAPPLRLSGNWGANGPREARLPFRTSFACQTKGKCSATPAPPRSPLAHAHVACLEVSRFHGL